MAVAAEPLPAPIQRAPRIRAELSTPAESAEAPQLPSALESVLSFKDIRAMQVGKTSADDAIVEGPSFEVEASGNQLGPEMPFLAPPTFHPVIPPAPIVKQPKKQKKKKSRAQRMREMEAERMAKLADVGDDDDDNDVEVEYVPEDISHEAQTGHYRVFHKIFEAFKISEEEEAEDAKKEEDKEKEQKEKGEKEKEPKEDDDDDDEDKDDDEEKKISKKKLKKMTRLSVAELK